LIQKMGDTEADTTIDSDLFRHEELFRETGSIRLIQVAHEISEDGYPACNLRNAIVHTSNYVCLSYTWGQPGDELPIRLNGKLYHVRRNLYDFLHVARKRLTYCWLWIDALCINQADTEERNHQVQQMGNIFNGAKMVVAWLGNNAGSEDLLQDINKEYGRQTWSDWEAFCDDKPSIQSTPPRRSRAVSKSAAEEHKHASRTYFAIEATGHLPAYNDDTDACSFNERSCHRLGSNPYWKRAWVTQEILLAKALVVVAGNIALDFPSLAHAIHYATFGRITPLKEYASLMLVQKGYHLENTPSGQQLLLSGTWKPEWGLMKLLKHFEGKCCAVRRDRIYSLLALCRDGDKIRVNYNASDIELILQVLHACKDEMCFCTAATVARVIRGSNFARADAEAYTVPVDHEFGLKAIPADTKQCPSCSARRLRPEDVRKGVYFCLKGIPETCGTERHGHLLWDNSPVDEVEGELVPNNLLWFQSIGGRRDPRMLCRRGEGVDITRDETEEDLYTLRFSLGALVDLEEPVEPTPSYSLHSCRH
jgi:hypothetical protein